MTNEQLLRNLTKTWHAGYILAIEDLQADIEKMQQDSTTTPTILLKLIEQKLKKSLKESQETLKNLDAL